jgi:hypothetical protein
VNVLGATAAVPAVLIVMNVSQIKTLMPSTQFGTRESGHRGYFI